MSGSESKNNIANENCLFKIGNVLKIFCVVINFELIGC